MRACIQRVSRAHVSIDGQVFGTIQQGLVVLIGAGEGDRESDALYVAEKVVQLRIFADADGKMNRSLLDINGQVLAISQFTLFGDVRKGRRPSFISAADPVAANRLYEQVIEHIRSMTIHVETGKFQANMQVELVNDGPVTILIDSKKSF